MTIAQIEEKAQQIADANFVDFAFIKDRPASLRAYAFVSQALAEKRGNFKMHAAVIVNYYTWYYSK